MGSNILGIDCSGLVQVSIACGLSCPGDSDQQLAKLGQNIDVDTTQEKGDIILERASALL